MSLISFNKDTNNKTQQDFNRQKSGNPIISGYFVKEKSYKEMAISRVNNFLCTILAGLVAICFISYYFVTCSELKLNQIRKETLTLNYENEDLQNKLDSLQSYHNIDKAVSRSNVLKRAKEVMEVSAAQIPNVDFKNNDSKTNHTWSMGY